jgi:hypothetical protein
MTLVPLLHWGAGGVDPDVHACLQALGQVDIVFFKEAQPLGQLRSQGEVCHLLYPLFSKCIGDGVGLGRAYSQYIRVENMPGGLYGLGLRSVLLELTSMALPDVLQQVLAGLNPEAPDLQIAELG